MTKEQFATRFAAARYYAGLTQIEAARRLGCSQPLIADYETGRRIPSMMMFFHIIEVLGLDPTIFFGDLDRLGPGERPPRRSNKNEAAAAS
jgi:transcriptional regulator with XRE-family HTH domain